MIEIIPAIDIIDGRCVRLTKGDYGTKKVYDASIEEMVSSFASCGVKRIHMVDLDGAKISSPANLKALESAANVLTKEYGESVSIEWGGGISSSEALESALDAGANYIIIGSLAVKQPELFDNWLSKRQGEMILGADVRDGKVAVKGWLEESLYTVEELIDRFIKSGLDQTICTDISRDGLLQGPSTDLYVNLQNRYPNVCITVSGGISSMEDIENLERKNLKRVIVGKAIYEGRITLKDIEKWSQNE